MSSDSMLTGLGFPSRASLKRKGNANRDRDDGINAVFVDTHDYDEGQVSPIVSWLTGYDRPEETEAGVKSE
ncbi:Nn.00g025630.m01.CDS01 [Neocucurbitaria sp. VM-36]